MNRPEAIHDLALRAPGLPSLKPTVEFIRAAFPDIKTVFSTSLSLEDQAITHMIAGEKLPIHIFTLDTGRHFPETYRTLQSTRERYGIDIEVLFPQTAAVESLMRTKGAYSF